MSLQLGRQKWWKGQPVLCTQTLFHYWHFAAKKDPKPPEEDRGEKRKHDELQENEVTEEKSQEEKKVCKGFHHFHTNVYYFIWMHFFKN